MTLEEMKQARKDRQITIAELSELSGVPLGTVQKVFSGITESPRYKTMRALEDVLKERTGAPNFSDIRYSGGFDEPVIAREEPMVYAAVGTADAVAAGASDRRYPRQGKYTLEDYLALPAEQRVELIDGVFYDMAAPGYRHQSIAGEIYVQLKNFVRSRKGACLPFIAPADVQLDRDDKTIVQPDVFVVCDRKRLGETRLLGAPDMCIEVLSPSTRARDMRLKRDKYEAAGVREYWLVDSEKRRVIVYLFSEEEPDVFIAADGAKVPVHIFGNECLIDLGEVWAQADLLEDGD